MTDHWIATSALVIAFVAALFAALQWASALRSARAAEKALNLQAKALSSQAADTTAALAISERLAKANEALAISGQRGWLVVVNPHAKLSKENDQYYRYAFDITFINAGKTPVSKVSARYCRAFSATVPQDFSGWCADFQKDTVVPDVPFALECHILLSNDDFSEFASDLPEKRSLFFYGTLVYTDIFDEKRHTHWRYRIDPKMGYVIPCSDGTGFD